MSNHVSDLAWRAKLPKAEQHVLLALADHAWDDGSHVFPSIRYTAWKTNTTRRTVQRVMRSLELCGILEPVKYLAGGRGHATEYRIVLEKIPLKPKYGPIEESDADALRADEEKGVIVAPFENEPIKGAKKDTKGAKKDTKGAIRDVKGDTSVAPTISNHKETSRNGRGNATPPESLPFDPENWADVRRWRETTTGRAYLHAQGVNPDTYKNTVVRYHLRKWLEQYDREGEAIHA